jgi:hypothetical protein
MRNTFILLALSVLALRCGSPVEGQKLRGVLRPKDAFRTNIGAVACFDEINMSSPPAVTANGTSLTFKGLELDGTFYGGACAQANVVSPGDPLKIRVEGGLEADFAGGTQTRLLSGAPSAGSTVTVGIPIVLTHSPATDEISMVVRFDPSWENQFQSNDQWEGSEATIQIDKGNIVAVLSPRGDWPSTVKGRLTIEHKRVRAKVLRCVGFGGCEMDVSSPMPLHLDVTLAQ